MHMVLKIYLLQNFFHVKNLRYFSKFFWALNRIIFACDIGIGANISRSTKFYHNGLGVVIHPKAIIGVNCSIYQNVTIGGNGKSKELNGCPTIGKNVFIGAGAVLIGPITIGDNAVIAANSVVICDVLPNTVVAGSPAKTIQQPK